MDIDEKMKKLAEEAMRMRSFSYTPYSGFNVGAALLTGVREGYIPAVISKMRLILRGSVRRGLPSSRP
jgi:cytidine deaminase